MYREHGELQLISPRPLSSSAFRSPSTLICPPPAVALCPAWNQYAAWTPVCGTACAWLGLLGNAANTRWSISPEVTVNLSQLHNCTTAYSPIDPIRSDSVGQMSDNVRLCPNADLPAPVLIPQPNQVGMCSIAHRLTKRPLTFPILQLGSQICICATGFTVTFCDLSPYTLGYYIVSIRSMHGFKRFIDNAFD